jgi:uncharacterized protein (TIGR00290 family)
MPAKTLLSWSGGKDSALALYEIQKAGDYSVAGLLTTITEDYDRVSMHGVRRVLLEQQAHALGLPLQKINIPKDATNGVYESRLRAFLEEALREGIETVAFGDIFLEDLRQYREQNLGQIGMKGLFPIWKRDSHELARSFIELGFKAVVVCVDTSVLDASFAGRVVDGELLRDLPENVDPCGENGEFHSFVVDGPNFQQQVGYVRGEIARRDRFCFCDLLPA